MKKNLLVLLLAGLPCAAQMTNVVVVTNVMTVIETNYVRKEYPARRGAWTEVTPGGSVIPHDEMSRVGMFIGGSGNYNPNRIKSLQLRDGRVFENAVVVARDRLNITIEADEKKQIIPRSALPPEINSRFPPPSRIKNN